MRSTIGKVCIGWVLVCSLTARAEFAHGMSDGSVTDVGPEGGITTTGPQSFLFHGPDEILAVAGRSGIYKSINRGESWFRSKGGLISPGGVEPVVQHLCQSAAAPEIAYVVTEYGVSRTTNFGDSWEPVTDFGNAGTVCAVDPSDPAVVYALAQSVDTLYPGRLFKSTDGGRSFSTVGAGLPNGSELSFGLAIAPTNPLTLYVSLAVDSGGLYASFDGGLTFQTLPNSPSLPGSVYAHPTEDGTLFVLADGLFLSTDRGASFEQIGAGLPQPPSFLAFDDADPTVVYVPDGPDGLFRSVDGARSFVRLDGLREDQLRGRGVIGVAVSPRTAEDPPVIYAGTSLGPVRSDDGGSTFAPIHDGFRGVAVNDLAIDAAGRLLLATFNSVGVFRSAEPGVYQMIGDTLPREIATYLTAVAAAPDDPELYLVGGGLVSPSGVFRTTDGGGSWTRAIIPGDPTFYTHMRIAFAPSDSRRVYMVSGTLTTGLFRSNDAGESFDQLAFQTLSSIAVDPREPDVLYLGNAFGTGGLFKSIDGGLTLRLIASGAVAAVVLDPQRPDIIYAAMGRTVQRSVDGGQSFIQTGQGLNGDRALGLAIVPMQPNRLFIWMHFGGLFRSDDGSDSWTPVETEEAFRRSAASSGQATLVIDRSDPERVYLGNSSVLQFGNP